MGRAIKVGMLGEIGVIIVMQCVGLFVSLAEEEEDFDVGLVEMGGNESWFWIWDFHVFETGVQIIMDMIGKRMKIER